MSLHKNKTSPKPASKPRRLPEGFSTMNKDSSFTYVHMSTASNADLFEDFCKDKLPSDEIFVPPQHQPLNPEDEDDVVPDQHAAFGITRATKEVRGAAWKDLGLGELMRKGPPKGVSGKRLPR
ncbi:Protein kinase [Metarhizium anisopliae]